MRSKIAAASMVVAAESWMVFWNVFYVLVQALNIISSKLPLFSFQFAPE